MPLIGRPFSGRSEDGEPLRRLKIDNFMTRYQDYVVTDSLSSNLARWAVQKEQRLGMGDVLEYLVL
jgi:hypothetical protein